MAEIYMDDVTLTTEEGETNTYKFMQPDGSYPNLTAGNAQQLEATIYTEDKVPYNFRTSGGSIDIGDRENDMVVGGTVVWNQLAESRGSTDHGITVSFADGVYTYSGTATGSYAIVGYAGVTGNLIQTGHVYALIADTSKISSGELSRRFHANGSWVGVSGATTTIVKSATEGVQYIQYRLTSLTANTEYNGSFKISVHDLTAMFGSTIADYVYSLEQSNAGAGVAWFKKLFPKPYYAYNAGELMSVKTSMHRMVGFNAYNPETETAEVLGGNQYQITGTYTALSLDGKTVTPDSSGLFTPPANGTLTVTGGNSTDTCVHLVWSGYRNGDYEPYETHEYALDDSLTLRGIPKLDENNNLYYDGDTYESDGTVTRNYIELDLGSFTWEYANGATANYFRTYVRSYGLVPATRDAVCAKYTVTIGSSVSATNGQIGVNGNADYIYVRDDAYTTAASFKTAMAGVGFACKKATPTTETADPYTNPQIVNDFGTEEYIDAGVEAGTRDVAIPVGHVTKYAQNLRAKLEMAPDSPSDGDGDYIVRQTNGENVYVKLASNATMQEIARKLPSAPTTNGTYVLKCTVSNGSASYAWEEQS